jgi:SOS response regulatory protein OraA/RecX
MKFWRTENSIEPRNNFRLEIEEYYNKLSNNRIPEELLNEIIEKVTDMIYSDYKRFWQQYPKSRKRYSKLKLEDVEHSFVRYMITDFLKKRNLPEYRDLSKVIFDMTDSELDEYEKNKYLYETK